MKPFTFHGEGLRDVVETLHFIGNRLMGLTNGLKATFGFAPGDTVISTYVYTLDGVGNRTNVDLTEPLIPAFESGTIGYTYDAGNILATANSTTYTHDANGNRASKTNGTNVTTYSYDSLNRLVQVVKGSQTTQYIYNGLGQRVGRIDNGVQTNYLIDPNGLLPQVLAETDSNNNLVAFYVYDGLGLVAKITPSNQYYFYHYDGLGSTVAITNSNGEVVNTYCYSPEGLVGAQETIPNPFQYVGRYGVMAEENGLYYMRSRYHDPGTGTFISKDPIGFLGGLNLYTYAANNPINFVDPLGLFWGEIFGNKPGDIFTIGFSGGKILGFGFSFDRIVMPNGQADWYFTLGGGLISPGVSFSMDRGKIFRFDPIIGEKAINYDFCKSDIEGFSVSGSVDLVLVGGEGAIAPFVFRPVPGHPYNYEYPTAMITGKGGFRISTPSATLFGNWTWDIGR